MASLAAWLIPTIIIFVGLAIAGFYLVKRTQDGDFMSNFRNRNPFARTFSFRPTPGDSIPTSAPPTAYVPPPSTVVVEKPGVETAAPTAPPAMTTPHTPGSGDPPSPAVQRILNMK